MLREKRGCGLHRYLLGDYQWNKTEDYQIGSGLPMAKNGIAMDDRFMWHVKIRSAGVAVSRHRS